MDGIRGVARNETEAEGVEAESQELYLALGRVREVDGCL